MLQNQKFWGKNATFDTKMSLEKINQHNGNKPHNQGLSPEHQPHNICGCNCILNSCTIKAS